VTEQPFLGERIAHLPSLCADPPDEAEVPEQTGWHDGAYLEFVERCGAAPGARHRHGRIPHRADPERAEAETGGGSPAPQGLRWEIPRRSQEEPCNVQNSSESSSSPPQNTRRRGRSGAVVGQTRNPETPFGGAQ